MEENTMDNVVSEELAENAADVVEEVAAKETFASKHPWLTLAGSGVALGAGVVGGMTLVKLAINGVTKLVDKAKTKIAEKKAAKAQAVVVEGSEKD